MKPEVPALGKGGEKREWRVDLEKFSEIPMHSPWGSLSSFSLRWDGSGFHHSMHLLSLLPRLKSKWILLCELL